MARERCVLVGVSLPHLPVHEAEEFLDELAELSQTAGAEVVHRFIQARDRLDPATFVGEGKAQEIASFCGANKATLVVFDDDLSPAQVKNLEKILSCKVMDRTGVILDIFARRARSRESKVQVELAQYTYLLPRLTRAWSHLSRQAGGIGTRGVGETQLETDRRVIRRRIALLTRTLESIASHREVQRRRRKDTFEVALVGYTNAGKSSLLNRLTSAHAFVEDRLFATLDTTFRRMPVEALRQEVLLIDTVGFIRKLPHNLVASFRSTLEQVKEADLLLHVLDASHPRCHEHSATTRQVLAELGLDEVPVVEVLNKVDRAQSGLLGRAQALHPEALCVSALTGEGLEDLRAMIASRARAAASGLTVTIPYSEWPSFLPLRRRLAILSEHYGELGVTVTLRGRKDDLEAARLLAEAAPA